MSLKSYTIAVLVEDLYEDLELWYPVHRLREEEAKVVLVGPEKDRTYSSKHGYPARVEWSADDVLPENLDGIVIPGEYAPDRMRRCAAMVDLVAKVDELGRVVAAICHGPWMLCSANVVSGRCVTGFFSIKDDLVNAGAAWCDEPVVEDKNMITSRTPDDLPVFVKQIIAKLVAAK